LHKIDSKETTERITHHISSKLSWINEKSRKYIVDIIILVNKEVGINKIHSIFLFGSQQVKGDFTPVSDCDLLFIFKDRVSNHHLREIERYFIALEIKHKFRDSSTKLTRSILGVINYSTGMFISHFLTKKEFWEAAKFHKIFRVNKVFSAIFAPRNIVLSNVILNSTLLYGEDLRNLIKPRIKISIREMFRSTVMNIFICFFGVLLSPHKQLNSIKYILESIKWSLKASNYFCFKDTVTLNKIIERFLAFEKPNNKVKAEFFYSKFINLRKIPQNDIRFIISSPIRILKMHIQAIAYRKMIKNMPYKIPTKFDEKIVDQRAFTFRY
jgi:predicted nucleotidyltransferase